MIVLVRILSRDDRHTLFKVKRILTIIVFYYIINIVKNINVSIMYLKLKFELLYLYLNF